MSTLEHSQQPPDGKAAQSPDGDLALSRDGKAASSLGGGVGRHLRRVRRRRGLTLAAVAARAGTSESFLSQLERGLTGVTLDTLARLAQALEIKVSDLFEPDHAQQPEVLRAGERPLLHVWRLGHKALLTPRTCEHLEVFSCRLEVGGSTGDEAYTHGDSDELFLVLCGEVELQLGERAFQMSTGDCITYRSSSPHRVRNVGQQAAEGLWVISPPSF